MILPKEVLINNTKLGKSTYKILTSDYLSGGGDKMDFFLNPINQEPIGIKLRDAILEYITSENEKGNKLSATTDNRIKYAK